MLRRILAIAIAIPLLAAGPARSADEESPRTKRTQTISARVFEKLEKAQEASDGGNDAAAMKILDELRKEKLSGYEMATIWNFIGSIRYNRDDFGGAIAAFREVLKQEDIPDALRTSTQYSIAQLLFATERYKEALAALAAWRKLVPEPSADSWALEGQIRYQMGDYKRSVKPLLAALRVAKGQNLTFKESWLAVLRASYYELEEHRKAVKVLEILVALYPKKAYWLQLAGLYGLLARDLDQLAAMEAAWEQGLLDRESELVNLAQLFMVHDVPYKAWKVLEKGMKAGIVEENYKNLRLLAQALALAQETEGQIEILAKAARIAPDGEMHLYLAQAYMEKADWGNAAKALEKALSKGLKDDDTARVMLGTARFNAGNFEGAREVFEQAAKQGKSAEIAKQWLRAIDVEEQRVAMAEAHAASDEE